MSVLARVVERPCYFCYIFLYTVVIAAGEQRASLLIPNVHKRISDKSTYLHTFLLFFFFIIVFLAACIRERVPFERVDRYSRAWAVRADPRCVGDSDDIHISSERRILAMKHWSIHSSSSGFANERQCENNLEANVAVAMTELQMSFLMEVNLHGFVEYI